MEMSRVPLYAFLAQSCNVLKFLNTYINLWIMLKVKLIFAFNLKPTFTAEYLLMTCIGVISKVVCGS